MRTTLGCLHAGFLLALTLAGCASSSSAIALDRAVMVYDRTVVDAVSKLLLLNIARAHLDRPMHFTTVSSIAASFDFRFNAGIGPAMTGDRGYLPMPSLGGSTAENPTITITPMQGDEFTRRLLLPFDEQKVAALLRQDYDIDALLRLMASELRVRERGGEVVSLNRPSDRRGYERFRRVVAHLSSVQDRRALHAEALQFRIPRTVPAASVSSEELRNYYGDRSLVYDTEKQVNEECFQYNECDALKPFIAAGKAVFQVEHKGSSSTICPKANALNFDTLLKNLDSTRIASPAADPLTGHRDNTAADQRTS